MPKVQTGLEVFIQRGYKRFQKQRLGILCNQASTDRHFRHISELVCEKKLKLQVVSFFGPQHGIRGEKQDNMVESADSKDERTQIPIHSLYSDKRIPSDQSIEDIDVLLVDLQDIGTRIYTFMYTMANCMIVAKKLGKKVIVLDRPNPINGAQIEGNVLESGFESFVGQYPLCTRHGMTMGELALLFNEAFEIQCDLEVIKIRNWDRKTYSDANSHHWIAPSPNIPNLEAAITFPGTVHFEGTNVSEGRGTTRPLECVGAPFIDPDKLAKEMNRQKLPGCYFRPVFFQPMFQKWEGSVCGGVHLHVTQRKQFKPFLAGIRLLHRIATMYPNEFCWKKPPYEYEYKRMPIDLIAGTDQLRKIVDSGKSLGSFEKQSLAECQSFGKIRRNYLIYP